MAATKEITTDNLVEAEDIEKAITTGGNGVSYDAFARYFARQMEFNKRVEKVQANGTCGIGSLNDNGDGAYSNGDRNGDGKM